MSLYYFDKITKEHSFLGSKGYILGLLKNKGFCVPDGIILTDLPVGSQEWQEIFSWWKENNSPKIAIRSSAIGEDSTEQSFAGQNSTYLNIDSEEGIKKSVLNCFQSLNKTSSKLYRQHFLKTHESREKMNVVLQIMVKPKISGVFFSVDPRDNEKGWVAEAILGYGEDLVSGKKTPWHFEENKINKTSLFDINELISTGISIRNFLGFEIDVEWAIDQDNQLQILQARPITALHGKSEEKRIIEKEIKRLKSIYPEETIWDGSTFSEWSGPPSELTFSIWKEAFAKNNSFSKALKKIGYLGINSELKNSNHSLLERIFNLAYVNISMLAPLYFGPIPYRIEFKKNPRLKFDFKKMTLKTFFLTPFTLFRMLKIAFSLSSKRRLWLDDCSKELNKFTTKSFRVMDPAYYKNFTDDELLLNFKKEIELFYSDSLTWPLVLIILIESTTQNIKSLLKGIFSEEIIPQKINEWLGMGVHTITMDMNNDYRSASNLKNEQTRFLQQYGHRGPGELELSHLRWIELGEHAFLNATLENSHAHENLNKIDSVEKQIDLISSYKSQIIKKEWILLREMLELRERWKMQILFPYAHLRFMAIEISKRYELHDFIFWFSFEEIVQKKFDTSLAQKRQALSKLTRSIYLPSILELSKLEDLITGNSKQKSNMLQGTPLSPGIVFGEVRVVIDPEKSKDEEWPSNTILVAESTDPGWTGLFLKSKAIVVEKGGVLSHCAIVAREMNLPAISDIKQCHLHFKDGDKIWVDGNNGRITLA